MPSDPDSRDAWQWWKTKKWALHIAYRMFNRYEGAGCVVLGGRFAAGCGSGSVQLEGRAATST